MKTKNKKQTLIFPKFQLMGQIESLQKNNPL